MRAGARWSFVRLGGLAHIKAWVYILERRGFGQTRQGREGVTDDKGRDLA